MIWVIIIIFTRTQTNFHKLHLSARQQIRKMSLIKKYLNMLPINNWNLLLFSKPHFKFGPSRPKLVAIPTTPKQPPKKHRHKLVLIKNGEIKILAFNQILGLKFHVSIVQTVSRQVHRLFQTTFPTECDLVLSFVLLYIHIHAQYSYTTNTASEFNKRQEICFYTSGILPFFAIGM
jgi:hypothetical protein